jgi:hypothetical protein
MAHFAEIRSDNNEVIRVIVVSNEDVNNNGGELSVQAEQWVASFHPQDEVLKKIESWESNEIDLTDEEIDQAIAEFNQMEILEAMEESSPESYLNAIELLENLDKKTLEQTYSMGEDEIPEVDESWDIGIDPIDKDDEPIYQTDSKELDKMLDIVDEAIDEKKK